MKKIPVMFLVSLLGWVLVFGMTTAPTFAHSTQARGVPRSSSSSTTHTHSSSRVSSRIQRHPLSETYDCDQDSSNADGDYPCDVASNATPCLRVHSFDNFDTIVECVSPGTTLYIACTVNRGSSNAVLGNTYWDYINLGSGQYGSVADAYMDTTWDPTNQGPDLPGCA